MSGERGAATLPAVAVALVAVLLGALIGDVAIYVRARTQAVVAADAAALAAAPLTFAPFGASGGPAAEAARLASANGAALESCECAVDPSWRRRTVRVVVTVPADLVLFGHHAVPASSRADFTPTALPP